MQKLKSSYEDLRLPGEQYMCDAAGPFKMDLDTQELDEDSMWQTCKGTHQGRPCLFRTAAIADWHLDDPSKADSVGYTVIGLYRYTSKSS